MDCNPQDRKELFDLVTKHEYVPKAQAECVCVCVYVCVCLGKMKMFSQAILWSVTESREIGLKLCSEPSYNLNYMFRCLEFILMAIGELLPRKMSLAGVKEWME